MFNTGISYGTVVLGLTGFVVTWCLFLGYAILPEGTNVTPRFNVVLSTNELNKQFLGEMLELQRSSNSKRCANLTTGKPEIRPSYLPGLKNPCWYAEGSHLRCLPYFYLAGLPKCGTTDLYNQITLHPDIIKASCKEPHWMSKRRFFMEGQKVSKKDIRSYPQYFNNLARTISTNKRANQCITGDGSASTLWSNRQWFRLRENCGLNEPRFVTAHYIKYLLPRVKIMAIMRNPTDRLYSGYLYFSNKTYSKDDFHEKVVRAVNGFRSCLSNSSVRQCTYNESNYNIPKIRLYLGLYVVYVQDWMKVFPKQQLHFIRLEDYTKNRLDTLKDIYKFLELRKLTSNEEVRILRNHSISNSNTKKKTSVGAMRPDTRKLLDDFYKPHNEQLAKLLGDDGYLWQ